jgi:hypothetical protein
MPKTQGLAGSLAGYIVPSQGIRWVVRAERAWRLKPLGQSLGGAVGRSVLTERFPGNLKKSIASGGIGFLEISDIGEDDTDRIATLDVTGLLVRLGISESEDDGIAGGKRFSGVQGEDRVAASTSLDLRNPLFVSWVNVH